VVALSHAARLGCAMAQGSGSGAAARGIGDGGRGRRRSGRQLWRWSLHPKISSSPALHANKLTHHPVEPSRMSFVRQLPQMPVATSTTPFGLPNRTATLFSTWYWIGAIALGLLMGENPSHIQPNPTLVSLIFQSHPSQNLINETQTTLPHRCMSTQPNPPLMGLSWVLHPWCRAASKNRTQLR
jgi:hypothetical protein